MFSRIVKSIFIIRSTRVHNRRQSELLGVSVSLILAFLVLTDRLNSFHTEIRCCIKYFVHTVCFHLEGKFFSRFKRGKKRKRKSQQIRLSATDALAVVANCCCCCSTFRYHVLLFSFVYARLYVFVSGFIVCFSEQSSCDFVLTRFNIISLSLSLLLNENFHFTCVHEHARFFPWPFRACAHRFVSPSCTNTGLSTRLHSVLKVQLYIKDNVAFFSCAQQLKAI